MRRCIKAPVPIANSTTVQQALFHPATYLCPALSTLFRLTIINMEGSPQNSSSASHISPRTIQLTDNLRYHDPDFLPLWSLVTHEPLSSELTSMLEANSIHKATIPDLPAASTP